MIKRTYRVKVENAPILDLLMDYCDWVEVDRVATGGMMSDPELLITYEGVESTLNYYAFVEVKGENYNTYHTIKFPDGVQAFTHEEFFEKRMKLTNIQVQLYTPENPLQ